eukprot:augustus_masked-scaffold_15-processed-gene-10.68-mRNA-1 protein AED:1.00 eAED:1.00 QI:0/0/0/0/1/1/2/0/220
MESELSKDVVRGLKLLGLQDAEVIMTDGSKALETAVEELGASHVLCRKHFFAILNSAAPSLRLVKKITSNLGDVLTRIFSGEKDLDQLIENMLSEFPDEPQHIALERIKKNKNKVCWEITKKVLTFSRNSSIPSFPPHGKRSVKRQKAATRAGKSVHGSLEDDRSVEQNSEWKFHEHWCGVRGKWVIIEFARKRTRRRKGKGENVASLLDFSQNTYLTDE